MPSIQSPFWTIWIPWPTGITVTTGRLSARTNVKLCRTASHKLCVHPRHFARRKRMACSVFHTGPCIAISQPMRIYCSLKISSHRHNLKQGKCWAAGPIPTIHELVGRLKSTATQKIPSARAASRVYEILRQEAVDPIDMLQYFEECP